MIETLHHRGPDGYGFYESAECGLAHARLSIIDLAGGTQPVRNESGSVWTVFNGEIFNFIELRRELTAAGHRFETHSDTEVIVHAYEQYGLDFVQHLNGQFAIALWDASRKRLVLARDRVGMRPLFLARAAGRLVFASEVKALFALHDVPRRLNLTALGDVLTYWSPLAPDSIFEGIEQLAPGHVLTIESGRETLTRYWDWQFPSEPPPARAEDRLADELHSLLTDSVRLQLRADVPVGAYLSGGLDSSSIAALVKRHHGAPLRTFGITFDDPEFDESSHQARMAQHLGTRHTSVVCSASDIGRVFPQVIRHTETPIVRTAPAPLFLLSECVRAEGFKVVLTGEGADEAFGGYDLFKEAKIRRFWSRSPASKARPALLTRLYPYLKNSPSSARAMTERFYAQGLSETEAIGFAHGPRWTTTRRGWQFFSSDARAQMSDTTCRRATQRLAPSAANFFAMGRDQYVEAHTLLSGYLLSSQGDRMAMAHSVEGRYPFLDHRVIEFANALPPQMKIRGLKEKYLLKRAVSPYLPLEITARAKQPYRAPDSAAFFQNGQLVDYAHELMSSERIASSGYFDPAAVSKLVAKCRAGRAVGFSDNMSFVCILSTMLVDEQLIRGRR